MPAGCGSAGPRWPSPHAAGVAALIREQHPNWSAGAVAAALQRSATPTPCPTDWPADDGAQCSGGPKATTFFGAGIVNALAAVS